MINTKVAQLVNYGLNVGLIEEDDKICITNNLLVALGLTDYTEPENVDDILKAKVGMVFAKVLEHSGVYKRTEEGKAAFIRFAESVK